MPRIVHSLAVSPIADRVVYGGIATCIDLRISGQYLHSRWLRASTIIDVGWGEIIDVVWRGDTPGKYRCLFSAAPLWITSV